MKVLIVDDEHLLREVCVEILTPLALEIVEAKNAVEAWEIFQKEKIDIVITDLRMPGAFDGLGLAEKILNVDHTIPVLLVTGFDEKENMLKAIQVGIYDFILKPFNPVYFTNRVQRAIEKRNLGLAQMKVIGLLQEMLNIPKDAIVERMSIQEKIEYIHELVAVVTIKKERET